jgi:hypothetical protein
MEDLEGDRAVVAKVLGEVHGGHPAAAELADQAIAVGEGRAKFVRRLIHAGSGGVGVNGGVPK